VTCLSSTGPVQAAPGTVRRHRPSRAHRRRRPHPRFRIRQTTRTRSTWHRCRCPASPHRSKQRVTAHGHDHNGERLHRRVGDEPVPAIPPIGASSPGDWACTNSAVIDPCGTPVFDTVNGTVRCDARLGGVPDNHLDPTVGGANFPNVSGNPNQSNGNEYNNIDDDYTVPDPIRRRRRPTRAELDLHRQLRSKNNPPISTLKASVSSISSPLARPNPGTTTVRYVGFRTNTGVLDGRAIRHAAGDPASGGSRHLVGSDAPDAGRAPDSVFVDGRRRRSRTTTTSSLRFTFESANESNNNALERGGGVSWAEAETPALLPRPPCHR